MGSATPSAALFLAACLAGCAPRSGTTSRSPETSSLPASVEVRSDGSHPPLTLIAREGDPFSAVAVALAHDGGARGSLGLAALLLSRLADAGLRAEAHPSGTGVALALAADDGATAARFVTAITDALSRPLAGAEGARVVERASRMTPPRTFASRADAAVGDCVGELGALAPPGPLVAVEIEGLRRAADSTRTVAFAAVGPRPTLEAPSRALLDAPAWPSDRVVEDRWPSGDVVGLTPSTGGPPTLSVALRLPDTSRVLELARELGDPSGPLATRVGQMEPAWVLDRAVGVARPRGGCVRFDLRPRDSQESKISARAAARAAAIASDEVALGVAHGRGKAESLHRGALEATDPREAAAVAAWQALAGTLPAGEAATSVSLAAEAEKGLTDDAFAVALRSARAELQNPTFELRSGAEPGQGQLWMLLANPCNGATESERDAGGNAVLVRAIADQWGAHGGVRLEPWISGEGVGILAHAARLDASESTASQAGRVADALGRALGGAPVPDDVVAAARTETAGELGSEVPALWSTALTALAGEHPSLLEPRGTWASLANLTTHQTEARRRAFIRGPLRLSVLTNGATPDARVAERALSRWLTPLREQLVGCPYTPPFAARPGEYVVDAPSGTAGSRALVAVTLPKDSSPGMPLEAAITAYLLNRPGGWLEKALRVPGIAPYAATSVLGGSSGAALAVEVAAAAPSAKEAVSQVRALFERLADGAATEDELAAARASLEAQRREALMDPRSRTIRLWLGKADPPFPDLAALRRFHHAAFAPARHVVVVTRGRP